MQNIDRGMLHVVKSSIRPSANDAQRAPIEGLMLSLGRLGIRVVALTSPSRAQSVRPLARALCASYAAADVKTILIDLDLPELAAGDDAGWIASSKLNPAMAERDPEGFDLLRVPASTQSRPTFNNLQHVRRAVTEDLGAYKAVILNLAPVLGQNGEVPNPTAVARAADGVLLVCGTAKTESADTLQALAELNSAGCKVIGNVLDDSEGVNPVRDITLAVDRSRIMPRWIKRRINRILVGSPLLNN